MLDARIREMKLRWSASVIRATFSICEKQGRITANWAFAFVF